MSWIRRIDLIEPYTCSPLVFRETSFLEPFSPFDEEIEDLCFPLGFSSPCPLDLFETVTDLVQIRRKVKPEYPLKYLCHRVSELESKFERLVKGQGDCDRKYKLTKEIKGSGEKKYTWEAEIQGPPARKYTVEAEEGKYKWTAEIKGGKKELALKKKKKVEKNGGEVEKQKKKKSYDWTTEMKSERENGEVSHTYVIKACSRGEKKEKKEKHEEDKEKKSKSKKKEKARVVVIEEDEEEEEEDVQEERRAIVLKKAFARRNGAVRNKKGKNT